MQKMKTECDSFWLSNVSEAHSCDEPVVIFFWHLRISDFVHTLKSHQLAKSHIRIKKAHFYFEVSKYYGATVHPASESSQSAGSHRLSAVLSSTITACGQDEVNRFAHSKIQRIDWM